MKAAIVRRIDGVGHVVLPKGIRTTLNIKNDDELEIFLDEDKIILQKRKIACEYCDRVTDVFNFEGHSVCHKCLERMVESQK